MYQSTYNKKYVQFLLVGMGREISKNNTIPQENASQSIIQTPHLVFESTQLLEECHDSDMHIHNLHLKKNIYTIFM